MRKPQQLTSHDKILNFIVNYHNSLDLNEVLLNKKFALLMIIQELQILGIVLPQSNSPPTYNILDVLTLSTKYVRPYEFLDSKSDFFKLGYLIPLLVLTIMILTQIISYLFYNDKQFKNVHDYINKKSNLVALLHKSQLLIIGFYQGIFQIFIELCILSIQTSLNQQQYTAVDLINSILAVLTLILVIMHYLFLLMFYFESLQLQLEIQKQIFIDILDYIGFIIRMIIIIIDVGSKDQFNQICQLLYLLLLISQILSCIYQYKLLPLQVVYKLSSSVLAFVIVLVVLLLDLTNLSDQNYVIVLICLFSPLCIQVSHTLYTNGFINFLTSRKLYLKLSLIRYRLIFYFSDNEQTNYQQLTISLFLCSHQKNCSDVKCQCKKELSVEGKKQLYIVKLTQLFGVSINDSQDQIQKQQYCFLYLQALLYLNQSVRAFQQVNLILNKQNILSNSKNEQISSPTTERTSQAVTETLENQGNHYMEHHHHYEKIQITTLSYIRWQKLLLLLEQTKSKLISSFDSSNNIHKTQLSESVQTFLKIEEQNLQIKHTIQLILNKKKDLFTSLCSQQKQKSKTLQKNSLYLVQKIMVMDQYLQNLFQEFPSRKMQSLNAFFQAEIMNNYLQAHKIINYNAISDQALIKIQRNLIVDFLSTKAHYLITCMDHQGINLQIKQKSSGVYKLFEYDQQEFNNLYDLQRLLPSGFQSTHKQLVEEFLITGDSKYFRQRNPILINTKSQWLKTVEFFQDFDLNRLQEITFSIFMTEIPQPSLIFIINYKGKILGVTDYIMHIFTIEKQYREGLLYFLQFLDINILFPYLLENIHSQKKEKTIQLQSYQFNFFSDFYQLYDYNKTIRNRLELNSQYQADLNINIRKNYYILEVKAIKKVKNGLKDQSLSIKQDDHEDSQDFAASFDFDISQEGVIIQPNDYNEVLLTKLVGSNNIRQKDSIQIKQNDNMDNFAESYQDPNLLLSNRSGQLVDKSLSVIMNNQIQQRFFGTQNQMKNHQEQSKSQNSSSYELDQKPMQAQKVEEIDDLKQQIQNDGKTSQIQEIVSKAEGSSTYGTQSQNFRLFKKYELLQQILGSVKFSIYFDTMLVSYLIMVIVAIVFSSVLLQYSSSDVDESIQQINIIDFQSSLMSPIYHGLSGFFTILNYRQIQGNMTDYYSLNQLGQIFINQTYSDLKQNDESLMQNSYLNNFFIDSFINLSQIQDDQLSYLYTDFRYSVNLLVQADFKFTKFNFTDIDSVDPYNSDYVFLFSNYLKYQNKTDQVNENILSYLANQQINLVAKWILLAVECIYLVMMFQLCAWLLLVKYLRKYLKILKLFMKVDLVWIYRDLERVKELLYQMQKDTDFIFKYRFNLVGKERFLIQELNRRQQLIDKMDKAGIYYKRDYQKLSLDRVRSFLVYGFIFSLFFIYGFVLTNQGVNYFNIYYSASLFFNDVSNIGQIIPQLYTLREINYLYSEKSEYIFFYDDETIQENLVLFDGSITSLQSFISNINTNLYYGSFSGFIDQYNKKDLCSIMVEDLKLYSKYCYDIYDGVLSSGLSNSLTKITTQLQLDKSASDNFTIRYNYPYLEIEAGQIVSNVIQSLRQQILLYMKDQANSLQQSIYVISILFILFIIITILIGFSSVRQFYVQEYQDIKKIILLLPQPALFIDDLFERQIRQIFQHQELLAEDRAKQVKKRKNQIIEAQIPGSAIPDENEEKMRAAAQYHFKLLDEHMIEENQKLMDSLFGSTFYHNSTMNETVTNTSAALDKYAFKIDVKFRKMNKKLNDHMYTTQTVSLMVIEDELRKKQKQLKILMGKYYRLRDQLPEQDEECSSAISCSDCLLLDGCGWCPVNEKCVVGDEDGPKFGTCTHYSFQFCQGKKCVKYDACNTCLSDPDCGWCQMDEDDIAVCLEQPHFFEGCGANWYHIEGPSFRCPRKTSRLVEEEQIEEDTLWMRPKKKANKGEKVTEDQKKKVEQQRKKMNDVEDMGNYQARNMDVRQREFEGLQRQIRDVRNDIKYLEERKQDIDQWFVEYHEENGIEEPKPEDGDEAQQEAPQEEKKKKKKKEGQDDDEPEPEQEAKPAAEQPQDQDEGEQKDDNQQNQQGEDEKEKDEEVNEQNDDKGEEEKEDQKEEEKSEEIDKVYAKYEIKSDEDESEPAENLFKPPQKKQKQQEKAPTKEEIEEEKYNKQGDRKIEGELFNDDDFSNPPFVYASDFENEDEQLDDNYYYA